MFERFTWELRATLLGNDARDTGITHIRPHGCRQTALLTPLRESKKVTPWPLA